MAFGTDALYGQERPVAGEANGCKPPTLVLMYKSCPTDESGWELSWKAGAAVEDAKGQPLV
jgi:hypothetical protein